MADMQINDPVPAQAVPTTIYRADYQPPAWRVPDIRLDFDLGLEETQVLATLDVVCETPGAPLRLNGDGLQALAVTVDGQTINDWTMDGDDLLIDLPGDAHKVTIKTAINPASNTQLMGLYASNGMLCTQCEAEGFRRITFFPDRPDVLSRYLVRMEGPKAAFPILLSNGDLMASGDTDNGGHYAEWRDPWPKPSYLFALVAGDLVANRDQFTTMNGRKVDLAIWVRAGDEDRTHHAMRALKNSFAWDERVYGREYDLDVFNIVAVSDFNMGAMENKGLNVFNTRYILADPDTATDMDYDGVEGVVAHEYFHNWSGNRVTCRDWFQLSLKEGFTVLRDQQFSADMGSAAVKRIEDVRILRAAQFPEDAGPLAHPIRPDSYMEISNFYTSTVYNKGAEIIRMMATMAGPVRFRSGTDLYFDRHDGEAATCEDFVQAMEDGAGLDLKQFRLWYSQAGTPRVSARLERATDGEVTLHLTQSIPATPGQAEKQPMVIPLRIKLYDLDGGHGRETEQLIILDKADMAVPCGVYRSMPVLSFNRGFSAPIIAQVDRAPGDLAWLARHDDELFARYEAMQQMMTDTLVAAIGTGSLDPAAVQAVTDAIAACLSDDQLDPALAADIITLPSEAFLGEQMLVIDPDAIHAVREALKRDVGTALLDLLRARYDAARAVPFALDAKAKAARRLMGACLPWLAAGDPEGTADLAFSQFETADNMTTRLSALATLSHGQSPHRESALAAFHTRFSHDPLVLDKWFTTQALSLRADALDQVEALAAHPDFTLANPNRVRALYGSLTANQLRFHDASGRGYAMLADLIITLDASNAQLAARLVPPLGRWRRFEPGRSALMKAALERIMASGQLSRDTQEQVVKSLA